MNGALTVAAIMVPIIRQSLALAQICNNGRACLAEEYCSPFSERCEKCQDICDSKSHNYHESDCNRYCAEYGNDDGLRSQVRAMQHQQSVILIVVIVLLAIVIASNGIKIIRWLKRRRGVKSVLRKLKSKKEKNGKEQPIGTISNVMHMNDADRPVSQSQVYSVTGMEGSTVLTVTTPVSTRYPAEDSTTTTEYSYDNAGLQVTPSSNKPPFPQTAY